MYCHNSFLFLYYFIIFYIFYISLSLPVFTLVKDSLLDGLVVHNKGSVLCSLLKDLVRQSFVLLT